MHLFTMAAALLRVAWAGALMFGVTQAARIEKRDCAANNYLRQVRATRPAALQHLASNDCSSFLAGVTSTITQTLGSV